jgi:choice-of-anchor A domain-containing protein
MLKKSVFRGFALAMLASASFAAAAAVMSGVANADPLNQYNLTVLGNMTGSSDVEGTAFIGGNLNGTSNFGTQLSASDYSGQNVLTVLGSIGNLSSTDIQLNTGNLLLGGSVAAGSQVNYNGGGTLVKSPLPSLSQIQSEVSADQKTLENLTQSSTYTAPTSGQNVTLDAIPGNGGVAVFSISASDLFGNSNVQSLNINTNGASEVVINLTGQTVNANVNFVGNFTLTNADSTVIWNFVNATSISVGAEFHGAILAPNAELTNSSPVDGSVVVGSLDAQSEIHLPLFTPIINTGTPTPEPASLAILALGIAGLSFKRLRRR